MAFPAAHLIGQLFVTGFQRPCGKANGIFNHPPIFR